MVDRLSKPQYLFRPSQIIRRFRAGDVVRTPWCEMQVGDDSLGRGIARMGVHELAVSEVIWRLSEGDDLALDVGANIGYFTGLLAQRVGEVIALEPNPLLWPILTQNVARWVMRRCTCRPTNITKTREPRRSPRSLTPSPTRSGRYVLPIWSPGGASAL
jgi:protein-L-isoaspartate O-methyltransferase